MNKKKYLMRPFAGEEELEEVKRVFKSKCLIEGPVTHEFEEKFAEYVGAKQVIAVTSCVIGQELALEEGLEKTFDEQYIN